MDSVLFDMAVSFVLSAIKISVKNPAKKAELKKVFLKIRNKINDLYAGDPDFDQE
jgi:hypothetical protein